MEAEHRVVFVDKPEEAVWEVIGRAIDEHNARHGGKYRFQRIGFALYGPDQAIEGGVLGELFWDWLHIDLLWVREELRGRGLGRRLLAAIEEEARRRGASNAFLDTFSFQAPDFYRKQGYEIFGELPDFPAGHRRTFLTKKL